MFKKVIASMLSFCLFCCFSVPTFAGALENEKIIDISSLESGSRIPVGDAKYIKTSSGKVVEISELLSFDTEEERDAFLQALQFQTKQYSPVIKFNSSSSRALFNDDVLIAQQTISYVAGAVNLRVAYTTSGSYPHTGSIVSHQAYTTFTGFTVSIGWDESMCSSQITSDGKSIFAQTAGVITINLFVDGFIEPIDFLSI